MKIQGLLFLEEVLLTVEICWNWLKWLIFINWRTYNSNWRAQNMETGPIKIMPYWWEEPKSPLLLFCSFFACFILFLIGVLGSLLLSSQCRAGLHELSIGRCWMLWVSEKGHISCLQKPELGWTPEWHFSKGVPWGSENNPIFYVMLQERRIWKRVIPSLHPASSTLMLLLVMRALARPSIQ